MYNKFVVDVSNLFYRNYFTHKDIHFNVNGVLIESGGIYGFIKSIQKLQKDFNDSAEFYFLWDNLASKDLARKELDPDYKLNRTKYSESFYRSLDYLRLILLNYSDKFFCIQIENFEADDLVPAILETFTQQDKILIISEDLDYSRCITDNVHLFKNHQVFTKQSFKEKYGFEPTKEKVVLWKTFKGDSSDNIPVGVPRLRENKIFYLINKYADIYSILENVHSEIEVLGEKCINHILDHKSRLILNYQLVDFIDIDSNILINSIFKGNFNSNSLRFFYKSLGFKIADIDSRLMMGFPEECKNESFFQFENIKRQ